MVNFEPRVNLYTGKWYKDKEARKVEKDLINNSMTGDNWRWVDRNGNMVCFT